jgi:hypothetical protein
MRSAAHALGRTCPLTPPAAGEVADPHIRSVADPHMRSVADPHMAPTGLLFYSPSLISAVAPFSLLILAMLAMRSGSW